jgi:predicted metal-dependent hydrolase
MQQLVVETLSIDVERKNIKSLRLAVYAQTGRVRLAAPLWLSDEVLRLYVISKLEWIKKHQARIAFRKPQPVREYVSGERHSYNGKQYVLEVVPRRGKPKAALEGAVLKLFVQENCTKHQRAMAIAQWYRERLQESIPVLVEKWEKRMKVEVREWGIKQMRTRWGSCNVHAHRVWLNLELAKKPLRCLEYVLVHEMVHLLERNHSRRFAALMSEFLPQWKLLKKELNGQW